MLVDFIVRFAIGGAVVSAFGALGTVVKRKTVAGIFSSAPSVALASLGLSYTKFGVAYVTAEARSMIVGAVALGLYTFVVSQLIEREDRVAVVTSVSWLIWLAVALPLYWLVLDRSP